jgi:hypothetical protein
VQWIGLGKHMPVCRVDSQIFNGVFIFVAARCVQSGELFASTLQEQLFE